MTPMRKRITAAAIPAKANSTINTLSITFNADSSCSGAGRARPARPRWHCSWLLGLRTAVWFRQFLDISLEADGGDMHVDNRHFQSRHALHSPFDVLLYLQAGVRDIHA